jgi:hypothetical protein
MKMIGLCVLAMAMLGGCATTKHVQAKAFAMPDGTSMTVMTDAECAALIEKRDKAMLAQGILSVLGGAGSAVVAIPQWDDAEHGDVGRAAVGITAAAVGASAGVVGVYIHNKNGQIEMWCEVQP